MGTKIEYDDAVATIGTLPTIEPRPNIYNLLKLEEIINTRLALIPSTQSNILGWAGMFMRPEIYALSEPNPWRDPANPGAIPPEIGNPNATDAEREHHRDLWKILKNQHDSFINIGRALRAALETAIPDQFKPVQQIGNRGFGNRTAREIIDDLFHTYGRATATDIAKIDDAIKNPWDPNEPIEMLFKQIEDAQIFALCANLGYDLPRLIMYALNNITNTGAFREELRDFYRQHNTHEIDWPTFKKFWATAWTEREHYRRSSGTTTYANIATDDDSISTFNTAVANLTAQRAQDNAAMSQLSDTNHSMQSNINTIMQELQTIKHQMNYTNAQATHMKSNYGPPSAIYAAAPMPPNIMQAQPPMALPSPSQHMNTGHMLSPSTNQWTPPPPGFHGYNNTQGGRGFQMTTRGRGRGRGNRPHNNNLGQFGRTLGFGMPRRYTPNPVKRHNNWYYCFSCGYDTDHEGHNCPWDMRKPNHNPSVTRVNAHLFPGASLKGAHKTILPGQPGHPIQHT